MCDLLVKIQRLVEIEDARISEHGYDELAADGILARDVVQGVKEAQVVEEYPDYHKGPCVLTLQADSRGPIHVLWGIPKGKSGPATLVTAYRPNPELWTDGFIRRK